MTAPGPRDSVELLPCPFCGGEPERIDFGPGSGDNEGGSCIACAKCQASGPVEFGRKENFVSHWNTRRALPQQAGGEDGAALQAEVARLREQAEHLRSMYRNACKELALANEATLQARAALREESARLDWLDGFAASSHFTISEYFGRAGKDRYVEIQDEDDCVISTCPTLREAIDKAMEWWQIKLREDAALGEHDA